MKKKNPATPSEIKVALKRFPKIVEHQTKAASARLRFVERTFGNLVRKVDKTVQGDQTADKNNGTRPKLKNDD